MTSAMFAMGDDARAGATDRHPIDTLVIALTEDEIINAAILQSPRTQPCHLAPGRA